MVYAHDLSAAQKRALKNLTMEWQNIHDKSLKMTFQTGVTMEKKNLVVMQSMEGIGNKEAWWAIRLTPSGEALQFELYTPPVHSLDQLFNLATRNERYQKLCVVALSNLGCEHLARDGGKTWQDHWYGLYEYWGALVGEYGESESDGEKSLIDEVNNVKGCIDQIAIIDGKIEDRIRNAEKEKGTKTKKIKG